MSRSWTEAELQAASEQMKKAGYMSYEEFCASIQRYAHTEGEEHMKKYTIQCSNCGVHKELKTTDCAENAVYKDGWGSCGSALYCPECTKTWKERNGDRPMASQSDTVIEILRKALNRQ